MKKRKKQNFSREKKNKKLEQILCSEQFNQSNWSLKLDFLSLPKIMFQCLVHAVENVTQKKTLRESGLQDRVYRFEAVLFSYISLG